MKRLFFGVSVALMTASLGVAADHLSRPGWCEVKSTAPGAPAVLQHGLSAPGRGRLDLSREEAEVVTRAEYFVCWNGYIRLRCGGVGKLYFEPGESPDDRDRVWVRRRDTLEGRAYGLTRTETGHGTLWTVVFRYTEQVGRRRDEFGRAYVLEDDHGPSPIRHFRGFLREYPLAKAARRL